MLLIKTQKLHPLSSIIEVVVVTFVSEELLTVDVNFSKRILSLSGYLNNNFAAFWNGELFSGSNSAVTFQSSTSIRINLLYEETSGDPDTFDYYANQHLRNLDGRPLPTQTGLDIGE